MAIAEVVKVPVYRNANYTANGTKSLVKVLHKYDITPTKEGPYRRDENHVLVKRQNNGTTGRV